MGKTKTYICEKCSNQTFYKYKFCPNCGYTDNSTMNKTTDEILSELSINKPQPLHELAVDKQALEQDRELTEYRKEICKHCRGKGYATYRYGISGGEDLEMGEHGFTKAPKTHIVYCPCERGQQLRENIDIERKRSTFELLEKLYKQVMKKNPKPEQMKEMLKGYWEDAK